MSVQARTASNFGIYIRALPGLQLHQYTRKSLESGTCSHGWPHHRTLESSTSCPHHRLESSTSCPHHRKLEGSTSCPHHRKLESSTSCPHHRMLESSTSCPHHRMLESSTSCPHHRMLESSTSSPGCPHHTEDTGPPSVPSRVWERVLGFRSLNSTSPPSCPHHRIQEPEQHQLIYGYTLARSIFQLQDNTKNKRATTQQQFSHWLTFDCLGAGVFTPERYPEAESDASSSFTPLFHLATSLPVTGFPHFFWQVAHISFDRLPTFVQQQDTKLQTSSSPKIIRMACCFLTREANTLVELNKGRDWTGGLSHSPPPPIFFTS